MELIPKGRSTGIVKHGDFSTVAAFILADKSSNTRSAYASDWRIFEAWCKEHGLEALPATPATVAAFITDQALLESEDALSAATITRRLASIRYAHRLKGHKSPSDDPQVRSALGGIRRTKGTAPKPKAPATVDIVSQLVALCPNTTIGRRDRALLLLGFAGAFRCSELVGLNVEDIERTEAGIRVHIRRSKTDQEGRGQEIAILRGVLNCPIQALTAWLTAAKITAGPIFRRTWRNQTRISTERMKSSAVRAIVRRYAVLAGLDPADYAAHSLRSGFITSAAERGANLFKIMEVSRHRKIETVKRYVHQVDLFKDHAGAGML